VRAGIIVTGVLGVGSALVFVLAIGVSTMFPNGGSIASNVNQVFMNAGGGPIAVPAVGIAVPVQVQPPVVVAPTPELVAPISDPGSPSPAASPSG
jgi:hypothetical protein